MVFCAKSFPISQYKLRKSATVWDFLSQVNMDFQQRSCNGSQKAATAEEQCYAKTSIRIDNDF
jgi:hypothetical protein